MANASEPAIQFSIFGSVSRPAAVEQAIRDLRAARGDKRGAVHTKPHVASFVLDLSGYTTDRPLHTIRLLEPSFGEGAFLEEAVRRLLQVWSRDSTRDEEVLHDAVRAVEIHRTTFNKTRQQIGSLLHDAGVSCAEELLDTWLICDDFLLAPLSGQFDVVAGNPPYVRHEAVPSALMQQYRKDYASIYDRADLYIPFIERGLQLLATGGRLSFICADRWMKNAYGGPLRRIVAERFELVHVVGLHGADVFEGEVDAYPSVFTIQNPSLQNPELAGVLVANNPPLDSESLVGLASDLKDSIQTDSVQMVANVTTGDAPWIFDSDSALAVLRALEARHPTIEEAGCAVGIGVATGADRVFIAPADDLPIESDRILPLVMARDVREDGSVEWSGKSLANPYGLDGQLVDLDSYPRLADYFEANGSRLRRRHVAKKSPTRWYKTIDKVHPGLAETPKLLIPDIKGRAAVAYDSGQYYPHHNLYHVTASTWDLRALQAVLRSRLAEFVVGSYAVRMRGGYLRFQAQYLRRIRIPFWQSIPSLCRERLIEAAGSDRTACDAATRDLFDLNATDWEAVMTSVAQT